MFVGTKAASLFLPIFPANWQSLRFQLSIWNSPWSKYMNFLLFRVHLTTLFELQGITLKLRPGSKVALVGPSGGGKVLILIIILCFLLQKIWSSCFLASFSMNTNLYHCNTMFSSVADHNSKLDREILWPAQREDFAKRGFSHGNITQIFT